MDVEELGLFLVERALDTERSVGLLPGEKYWSPRQDPTRAPGLICSFFFELEVSRSRFSD